MAEAILGPDEGERTSDRSARTVLIKADRDEFALTWSRYETGQSGPDSHIHEQHSDCFYVLEGELLYVVGPDDRHVTAGPATFVLVPPMVVHTFRNEAAATARFLNIHAPGCGFADHLRALRDGRRKEAERFDTHDPPSDGGRSADDVVIGEPEQYARHREATAGEMLRNAWIVDGALTLGGGAEAGPGTWVGAAAAIEGGRARLLEITA